LLLNLYNIKMLISIFLTALVIKSIDYYIDSDIDGFAKILDNIGKGILPYCLIVFAFACTINKETSISLLISAYCIGMFDDLNRELSFKSKGYQEGAIVSIAGIYFLGLNEMLSSMLIIGIIQLLDDIIDLDKDKYYSLKNYVLKFGIVEIILVILIMAIIAIELALTKLLLSILVFIALQYLEFRISGRKIDEYRSS